MVIAIFSTILECWFPSARNLGLESPQSLLWNRVLVPPLFNQTSWSRRVERQESGLVEWVLRLIMAAFTLLLGKPPSGSTTCAKAFADNCIEMASVMPTAMLQRLAEHLCLLSMKSLQISEYLRTVRSLSRIISSHMSTSLWMLVTETWAPRVSHFSILQLSKEQVSQEWQ